MSRFALYSSTANSSTYYKRVWGWLVDELDEPKTTRATLPHPKTSTPSLLRSGGRVRGVSPDKESP